MPFDPDLKLDVVQAHLDALQRRAEQGPAGREDVLPETFAELRSTLEALRVAEHELRQQNDALLQSRQLVEEERHRYRDLFEFAPDGYLITTADGTIREANHAAAVLLRVPADSLMGKPLVLFVADHQHREFRDQIDRLRQDGNVLQWEAMLRPRGANAFPAAVKAAVERNPAGQVVGMRWLIRDTTDLVHAQTRALASERLAAIGQMVSGLSHEGRNCLQRSQACLEMLGMELRDRPSALSLIQRVQAAQNDLHRLYEEVHSYAAPLKPKFELRDLGEILREAWGRVERSSAGRKALLYEEAATPDLAAEVDPLLLRQAFANILQNSLAACRDPVQITVHWSAVEGDGQRTVRAAVRDNGPGFTDEQRSKIFEPFYTTKTHGVGLGMAIAKRIVEAHGGRIAVGASPDPGAEIQITLPRRRP